MKIGKYKFTKQEIIKWIFIAYLPIVVYIYIKAPGRDFGTVVAAATLALFFTYPIHLLINFKIRKFIKWFFIGFIPCFALFKFHLNTMDDISLLSSIRWTIGLSGFMSPMILAGINLVKDFRELLKDTPLSFKIMVIGSVVLMVVRSVRNYLIHRG